MQIGGGGEKLLVSSTSQMSDQKNRDQNLLLGWNEKFLAVPCK